MTQNTPYQALYNALLQSTVNEPKKWKSSGGRCYLFYPNVPAISICNYYDENGQSNVSVTLIDRDGNITNENIINENKDKASYEQFLSLYNQIAQTAQASSIDEANEALFESMRTSYTVPDIK